MISQKDVVTLRIPFPNINAVLAVKAHMYICVKNVNQEKEFVKCQTFKPLLLTRLKSYIVEQSDISKNPFAHSSIIDLEKSFLVFGVIVPLSLLTQNRKDICIELFQEIIKKLPKNKERIKTDEFLKINGKCKEYEKQ